MSILTFLKKLFFNSHFNSSKTSLEKCKNKNNTNNIEEENINVYDCIIPLNELVIIDIKSSFDELLEKMKYSLKYLEIEQPNNFALIYHDNTDDLVGIVYSKDIIWRLKFNSQKDGCDFLFSPITFVPLSMSIENALDLMNKKQSPVLLVVDTKGATLGVITKNSIIDYVYKYDCALDYFEKYVIKEDNIKSITVEGTLLLKHIPKDWYLKEYDECYISGTRTLGGFLGYQTGMIPQKNTEIKLNNFTFKILEGSERFVKTILISKIDE